VKKNNDKLKLKVKNKNRSKSDNIALKALNKSRQDFNSCMSVFSSAIKTRTNSDDSSAFIVAGLGQNTSEEHEKLQIIIDSGASCHLVKSRNAFRRISIREKIRIRGVAGVSWGCIGILKPNIFGRSIRAVYFPELPVEALISVTKLKLEGWEVRFSPLGDTAKHLITGALVKLNCNSSGLPSIESLGTESNCKSESGFVCTNIGEAIDTFSVSQLIESMAPQTRKSVGVAGRKRKRGGEKT